MTTAQYIVAYFQSKGLTRAQAAGIAGNAMQESSDNPNAAGGGLFQDIGGRGAGAGASLQQQLDKAWAELTGPERGTLERLRRTTTPTEAARVFSEGFERPGIPEVANRERYAQAAAGGAGGGPQANPLAGAGTSAPAKASGFSLVNVGIKAFTYLALLGGALAMLWIGSKTFLQPKPKAATA